MGDSAGVTNLDDAFAAFDDTWMPRIVAKVNDYDVRIAKVEGDHAWHVHHDTDEFFLVVSGEFTVNLRSGPVVLRPGDTYVVPRGVEHFPQAAPGTRILMFEPTGTPNTGDEPVDAPHLQTTTGIDLTTQG
jgi:mannose-6-phosphate isomerase-like protein (cupin superfamily)